jgi:HNH endonuclease
VGERRRDLRAARASNGKAARRGATPRPPHTGSMDQMSQFAEQVARNVSLLRKLLSNVKPTANGCLEWTGWCTPAGYGTMYNGERSETAHRIMFRVTQGEIPEGHVVRHKCDNPPCSSPTHLIDGTDADNTMDAVERGRHHEARKTRCERGHELSGENVYVAKDGTRHCKTCNRAHQRLATGWPEELAWTVPKKQGWAPKGMVRIEPKPRRPHNSTHCGKGHLLEGDNRYVTRKGHAECRICREAARQRYIAKRQPSGEVDAKG